MKEKLRRLTALLLAMSMALALAACGSSSSSDSTSSESTSDSTEVTSESTADDASESSEPVVINVGSSGSYLVSSLEASGVDAIASVTSYGIFCLVYETLFYMSEDGEMVSDLVEEYAYSDDYLTLTIQLKDGIYFANGDQLTGEDVLFSLQCKQTSSKPAYYTVIDLDRCTVSEDGLTITLEYNTVFGPGINYLDFYIVDKTFYESLAPDGDYSQVDWYDPSCVNGSGPYAITSFVQDTSATLTLRDDYWNEEANFEVDVYNLYVYSDKTTMYIDFENQVIDLAIGISSEDATRLSEGDLSFGALGLIESNAVTMLCLNENSNEYLADEAVRAAIAYALDIETITDTVMGVYGTAAQSTLSQNMAAFVSGHSYEYNPEYAKQLLEEAGYEEGEITLYYMCSSDTEQSTLAEMVQGYLRAVGITVELDIVDTATLLPSLMQGLSDFQRQTASDGSPLREVLECYSALTSDSVFAAVGIQDEEINYYLQLGYSTVDTDERIAAYQTVQDLLYASYRCIPLYEWKAGYAYNTDTIANMTLLSSNRPNLLMIHPA